jgi:hypothetical protein
MFRRALELTAPVNVLILGLIGIASIGCSRRDAGDSSPPGKVSLALTVPSGAKVNTVHYVIHAGAPAGIADATGDINTSDPNAPASAYRSFPASMGIVVTLSATTTAGESCTGASMPFNLAPNAVASVDVTLVCGGSTPQQGNGSVKIGGTVVEGDDCPVLTAWAASPRQTSLGGKIDVSGAATDADVGVIPGEVLTFSWSGGTFDNAGSPSTKFTCTVSGTQTIKLTVSDNHAPTPCSTSVLIAVTCIGGGICGNNVVDEGEQCEGTTYTPGIGICNPATCHYAAPSCNNGRVELGEQCDPPNGTTCSPTCQTTTAPALCGNGIRETGEQCDPPNGTTCSATCQTTSPTVPLCVQCEIAATTAGTCYQTSTTANAGTTDFLKFGCNGFVGTSRNACDALITCLRNNDCGDGGDPVPCLCGELSPTTCATRPVSTLPGACVSQYITAANGGDVYGLFFSTDSPIGVANNLYTCDVESCAASCLSLSTCGDGAIQGSEQCEPPNTATCTATCQLASLCGNNVVGPGEQCDPPNGTTCSSTCHLIGCGNAIVESGEQCDPPGSATFGLGVCSQTCQWLPPSCGNQVVEPGEQCDPAGTVVSGSGICGPTCQWLPPSCGNQVAEPGEQCDPPGSTNFNFGICNASCQYSTPACGDLVVTVGEQCDPPNGTTCDANCRLCGAFGCVNCQACEMASTVGGLCFQTSSTPYTNTADPTKFGCNGFMGAERTSCEALIQCLRTNHCGAGSDPTPCLCGDLPATTCVNTPLASLTGACVSQYVTAAAGGDVFGLFFSIESPVGVANNLYTCDVDACPGVCL